MIKIYIFADSYKHFETPIKEYEKRLWKDLKIIKLKPSKKKDDVSVIKEETEIIRKKLENEKGYKIILSPNGKKISTEELVQLVQVWKMNYWNIIFMIWWAAWFDYLEFKGSVDYELSLSEFIMPHSLALLVIVEQVYRVWMIEKGSNYHK